MGTEEHIHELRRLLRYARPYRTRLFLGVLALGVLGMTEGVIALMEWVENGNAPDCIPGEAYDLSTGELTMTRPLCAYPARPRYDGHGDPNNAASYRVEA